MIDRFDSYKFYLRNGGVSCFKLNEEWQVRFRDFWTTKQERSFRTESEAQSYAKECRNRGVAYDLEQGCPSEIEKMLKYWESIDER